jgi:gliding motility-associated-like protein
MTTHYGCELEKSYPCLVTVASAPIANFDFKEHYPNEIEHVVDFWDESTLDVTTWRWVMGDSVVSETPRFSLPIQQVGDHNMKLVVYNEFGCVDSTNTNLEVAMVTTYFIPEAFTPGNDDVNEVFNIVGARLLPDDFLMEIFDRWGKKVFQTKDITEGWNGTSNVNGELLPAGTYGYKITFKTHTGLQRSEVGELQLIR